MKRSVVLLLALTLLFGIVLTGCSGNTTVTSTEAPEITVALTETPAATAAPAATEEMLENSKPNAYIPEKLAAGMEVLVGITMPVDVPILMEVWAGEIKSILEPKGFTISLTHAGGDIATMLSQMENFSTMGAAAIIIVPTDGQTPKETALKCMERGTHVIAFGVSGVDYCFSVRADTYDIGYGIGACLSAWVDWRYPDAAEDSIKCAALCSGTVVDKIQQDNGMKEACQANPKCIVVYAPDGVNPSIDDGYTYAENAMTFDPGIRGFMTHDWSISIGVSNYIMSLNGVDPGEFGTFSADYNDTVLDMIQKQASKNACIFRGTNAAEKSPGVYIGEVSLLALMGEQIAPWEYMYGASAITQPEFTSSYSYSYDNDTDL